MRILLLLLFITICPLYGANHEGIPFFVNYPSATYQAHNRNFDVTCDRNGHVYIANFEGILHYDYNRWEVLYTPGYSRVTRLFTDSQGRIWAGGYNVLSRIVHDNRGCLALKVIASDMDKVSFGELDDILEIEGTIYVKTTVGNYYVVRNDSSFMPAEGLPKILLKKLSRNESAAGVNQALVLMNDWTAQATENEGLVVKDQTGIELFALTERNGLCSNSVSHIATDGKGNLWGTTDNGVFCVFLPSAFSRYTSQEGVKGEVISMIRYKERLFVGTLQGLYVLENNAFIQVKGIKQACWMLRISSDNQLYAATSGGVFHVRNSQRVEKILETATFSLDYVGRDEILLGTMDGIYRYCIPKRKLEKLAEIEKVMYLEERDGHAIEARTLYGENYVQEEPGSPFVKQPREEQEAMTVYTDKEGYRWQTDLKGKNLQAIHQQNDTSRLNRYLKALRNYVIRVIFIEEQQAAWFGGDFGLVRFDLHETDFTKPRTPRTFLREIRLNHDSIFCGGFYVPDGHLPMWGSETRSIHFSFATDAGCFTGANMYRSKLEGYDADWSTWSPVTQKDYANLFPGKYTFQIQSKDIYDNESEVERVVFTLLPPFYLKWYSILGYLLVFAGLMYLLFRWRMRKLLREKEKLEEIVNQRTQQLVEQKDEIEEKSRRLETALDELGQAQDSLVRQEKMATVGKLTQGLIDRILNPLNYINNFSHLTTGLVQDLRQNLEDVKEQLEEDTYQDSLDVIEMMASNLKKIEEHGANTTRILKAMEEILKNHGKRLDKLELTGLCGKCVDQLNTFYAKEIETMQISVNFRMPEEPLYINGNTEQLGKALMSLLNNGMYAVIKKYNKAVYEAEVCISLERDEGGNLLRIHLRDNGIGIEATILDKIFDPFFTTKTTGEAAGIGLYLGREVILNHNGQITVTSQKDEYTEFTITLPVLEKE